MDDQPPVRKFMFDRAFDSGAVANRAAERKPVTLKPEQVDALKQESFDAGFAAGRQAALDDQGRELNALLARIHDHVANVMNQMQAFQQEQDTRARQMVMAIARKILPDFTAKNGLEEIQALLSDVLTEMVREPRLVVRVNDAQFEAINARVTELTAQKAYAGQVIVLADSAIACGDCRVEWADGGMERDTEATLNDIERIVAPADASSTS